MSKITTVYDGIVTALGTLYPAKTRIPNAIDLEDNIEGLVRNGYGLKIDGSNVVPHEFCNVSNEYNFVVVLTHEVIRTDSQHEQMDTAMKSLFEDAHTVEKDFYNVDKIGLSDIEKIDLGGVGTPESFIIKRKKFLAVDVSFLIQIRETL